MNTTLKGVADKLPVDLLYKYRGFKSTMRVVDDSGCTWVYILSMAKLKPESSGFYPSNCWYPAENAAEAFLILIANKYIGL